MTMYQVFDTKLHCAVGKLYTCAKHARTRRDALDLAYGAVRYVVRSVEVTNA